MKSVYDFYTESCFVRRNALTPADQSLPGSGHHHGKRRHVWQADLVSLSFKSPRIAGAIGQSQKAVQTG